MIHRQPQILLVISIFFPYQVSARGGRGRISGIDFGGNDGGGGGDGGSDDDGDSIAAFYLEPMDAAIFAFCVIFAVVTALQAYFAAANIRRRILKVPPSISSPEFSLGYIFPCCLLTSAIFLTIAYILHAVYWGFTFNQNTPDHPDFSISFLGAWDAMGFLADIFLVFGILALLWHREKILISTSRAYRDIKMFADVILIVILFALSLGNIGVTTTDADIVVRHNLYVAYISFFLVAVVDIAVSSTILYIRSLRSPVNDNIITLCTAFIISPLFIMYALFPIVLESLQRNAITGPENAAQWQLAGLIVGCITEVIIIQACLRFGMPPITGQGNTIVEGHSGDFDLKGQTA